MQILYAMPIFHFKVSFYIEGLCDKSVLLLIASDFVNIHKNYHQI